jgi:hypothetical protein
MLWKGAGNTEAAALGNLRRITTMGQDHQNRGNALAIAEMPKPPSLFCSPIAMTASELMCECFSMANHSTTRIECWHDDGQSGVPMIVSLNNANRFMATWPKHRLRFVLLVFLALSVLDSRLTATESTPTTPAPATAPATAMDRFFEVNGVNGRHQIKYVINKGILAGAVVGKIEIQYSFQMQAENDKAPFLPDDDSSKKIPKAKDADSEAVLMSTLINGRGYKVVTSYLGLPNDDQLIFTSYLDQKSNLVYEHQISGKIEDSTLARIVKDPIMGRTQSISYQRIEMKRSTSIKRPSKQCFVSPNDPITSFMTLPVWASVQNIDELSKGKRIIRWVVKGDPIELEVSVKFDKEHSSTLINYTKPNRGESKDEPKPIVSMEFLDDDKLNSIYMPRTVKLMLDGSDLELRLNEPNNTEIPEKQP